MAQIKMIINMMESRLIPMALTLLLFMPVSLFAADIGITPDLHSIEVTHHGKTVLIERNQNPQNTINPAYAKTSRACPPFCIQPVTIAPGVETIGELEVLDYLQRIHRGDPSILVIDSRTPDWLEHGTIPGSINIPWTELDPESGADPFSIADLFQDQFGIKTSEGLWDFSGAKTLVLFCNGMWCGQSPSNIRSLLGYGYPAHKLKWYRGGMQDWESLGLTVVKPDSSSP